MLGLARSWRHWWLLVNDSQCWVAVVIHVADGYWMVAIGSLLSLHWVYVHNDGGGTLLSYLLYEDSLYAIMGFILLWPIGPCPQSLCAIVIPCLRVISFSLALCTLSVYAYSAWIIFFWPMGLVCIYPLGLVCKPLGLAPLGLYFFTFQDWPQRSQLFVAYLFNTDYYNIIWYTPLQWGFFKKTQRSTIILVIW